MAKSGDKLNDEFASVEKHQKRINVLSNAWGKTISKVKGVFSSLAGKVAGVFSIAAIIDATKLTLEYNTKLKSLSYQMGEAGKTTGQLTNAMYSVAKATGISVDKAGDLVIALRKMRVPTKDIAELGSTTQKVSEITGMTAESTQRLTGELIRTGKMGVKSTESILASMVKVQRVIGLTNNEMEQLNETIISSTRILHQYGKSAGQIEKFNKGVVKLAGAFSSVGIKADEASQLVDQLLDPGRVQDNALLYARLGVSMKDALSGDVDPGMLAGKFKSLGTQLKGMSNAAASAYAKQLGKPLQTLRAMADIDMSKLNKSLEGGANASEAINKAWKQQLSPQQKFRKAMEQVKTTISSLLSKYVVPLLAKLTDFVEKNMGKIKSFMKNLPAIFEKVKNFVLKIFNKKTWLAAGAAFLMVIVLIRRKFLGVAADFSKTVEKGVSEALGMAVKKTKLLGKRVGQENARMIDIQTRIIQGKGYKTMQQAADKMEAMAESNLFPSVARMTKNTANWIRDISMGSRPLFKMDVLTKELNKHISQRVAMIQEEKAIQTGIYDVEIDKMNLTLSSLEKRRKELGIILKQDKNNLAAHGELSRIDKEIISTTKKLGKNEQEKLQTAQKYVALEEKFIKKLAPEEKKIKAEILITEQNALKASINSKNIRFSEISNYKEILASSEKIYKTELRQIEIDKASGQATADQLKRYREIQSELKNINNETMAINNEHNDLTSALENEKRQLSINAKQMIAIEKATGKTIKDISKIDIPLRPSFIQRSMNFIKAGFSSATGKLVTGWDKIKRSSKIIGMNIVKKLNPANWVKGIKAKLRGFGNKEAKATGGAMRGLGRKLGGLSMGIGLFFGLLMRIKPIQKLIGDILSEIGPVLSMVMKALTPLIETMVKMLVPIIIKILGYAVQILGLLIKTIGNLIKSMLEMPARIGITFRRIFQGETKAQAKIDLLKKQIELQATSKLYQFGNVLSKTGSELIKTGSILTKMNAEQIEQAKGATYGQTTKIKTPGVITATKAGRAIVTSTPGVKENRTAANTEKTAANTDDLLDLTKVNSKQDEERNSTLVEMKETLKKLVALQKQTQQKTRKYSTPGAAGGVAAGFDILEGTSSP